MSGNLMPLGGNDEPKGEEIRERDSGKSRILNKYQN